MIGLPAILAMLLALLPLPALAQSIGEPLPGRRDPLARKLPPAPAERAARPCPEYGPGFVRLEGSSACVRIGGAVRLDLGKTSRSGDSGSGGFGSSARGRLYLEGRAETGLGSVRTVISTEGRVGRGLEGGNWRYR